VAPAPGTTVDVAALLAQAASIGPARPFAPSLSPAGAAPFLAAASIAAASPSGFTLRRVPNPRYRPPTAIPPSLGIASVGPLHAIDHLRVQIARRGGGYANRLTEWQLTAGERRRDRDALEFSASGESRYGRSDLRAISLLGRLGDVVAGLGDVPAISLGRMGSLQRLRGLSVASTPRTGAYWRGVSGVPTPVPGLARPRLGLAGAMVENMHLDGARTTLALFGFARGRVPHAQAAFPGDTLPGGGGAATVDVRAPLPLGTLTFALGGQIHSLEGTNGLAAQQAVGWSLSTPRFVLDLHDERATGRTRLLRTEGFALAPEREDRWNAQARLHRGRVETHFSGVVRDGGDPSVAARTMQVGASGSWGQSRWYSGTDLYFHRRMIEGVDDRRFSLYTGRISSLGDAMLLRFDRTTDDLGRDAMQAALELAFPIGHGARLSFEPRCAWEKERAQQANLEMRMTLPFQRLGTRLTGSILIGAQRTDRFRPATREATLAISLAPRPHDRADVEVRRRDDPGLRTYETTASYDLAARRYENLGVTRSRRDDGEITVVVARSDRSGVADVLVQLDGQESRFTDASGVARFERVTAGVHLVTMEERSLPAAHQPMSPSRVFVTVERGVDTAPVRFEIARPVRRAKF
jgi:hypothetical protein